MNRITQIAPSHCPTPGLSIYKRNVSEGVSPDPPQVRKGMNRIKQVLSGRLTEHEQPLVREQLKSILDAM